MGQWLSWIKSNEKQLLKILDDLAKKAVETSEELVILLSDLTNEDYSKKIHALEKEADILTREIFSELNKTFITPLDREDMQRIASKIDDVIDFMDGIAARIFGGVNTLWDRRYGFMNKALTSPISRSSIALFKF